VCWKRASQLIIRLDKHSIPATKRWKHTYRCSEKFYEKNCGFAQFCFLCSCWITNQKAWLRHCQNHIDKHQVPFRCNPVFFRQAVACAGYCPIHLGRTDLPADTRMQQYLDTHAWKRHVSQCVSAYINARVESTSIACPHPECPRSFESGQDLQNHLKDVHSIEIFTRTKRKSSPEDCQDGKFKSYRPVKRTRTPLPAGRNSEPLHDSTDLDDADLVDLSTSDFEPSPMNLHWTTSPLSGSTSPRSSDKDSLWDQRDDFSDAPTELSSQLDDPAPKHLDDEGRYFPNTSSPTINDISSGPESQSSDSSAIFPTEIYNEPSPRPPAWLVDPELQRFSDHHREPRISTLNSDQDSTRSKTLAAQIPPNPSTRDRQTAGGKAHLLKDCEVRISEIIQATEPEAVAEETLRQSGQDNELAYSTPGTPKDSSEDYYMVECLLDEWKGWFYVKWGDGSYSWQPRGNILDRGLIEDLRRDYKGLGPGVEILHTRRAKGKKVEYRVHFKGRPSKEDIWVLEKVLSPELIGNPE